MRARHTLRMRTPSSLLGECKAFVGWAQRAVELLHTKRVLILTLLSALPVVSHVVQLFLEPYAVSQVLTFFEAFPLSPGCSVHPFLRCRSTLLNVHKYYYTMTCLLKRNRLHYCLTNMCLASFCTCTNVCGRLMMYKQTYIQTQLAFTSPIRGSLRSPQSSLTITHLILEEITRHWSLSIMEKIVVKGACKSWHMAWFHHYMLKHLYLESTLHYSNNQWTIE